MPTTFTAGGDTDILQSTIGAYADEAYTTARKLSSTGIVGGNPLIDTNTETFIGQLRWMKPLAHVVNVASLTAAADGAKAHYDTDFLSYIKTVRTHGADKINMKQVVTQHDGLAKIGRDFGNTQAQDEHESIISILKGVAISEAMKGAAGTGGQTFDNDPADAAKGFYVDMGAAKIVAAADGLANMGAQRAAAILEAFGKAYKDYEPPYAYLITNPETMASFRSANLVDQSKITDGNVDFETIFNGKFRLIQTRASIGLTGAEITKLNTLGGTDLTVNAKTTYIVLPGALAMEALNVPDSTEITRNGNSFNGGGVTTVWRRWGYVLAPAGYDWTGKTTEFPSNDSYKSVITTAGVQTALVDGAVNLALTGGVWTRKGTNVLSLGILPVFHS